MRKKPPNLISSAACRFLMHIHLRAQASVEQRHPVNAVALARDTPQGNVPAISVGGLAENTDFKPRLDVFLRELPGQGIYKTLPRNIHPWIGLFEVAADPRKEGRQASSGIPHSVVG
jgi:hypothetical protein